MSWQRRYTPGSFRGVPFTTEGAETETGRRTRIHEYPQRDIPYAEDLGRSARQFTIDCFVAGPNYMDARDRLIDACEAEGPGTLVHPFRGSMTVVCLNCRTRESAGSEGGGIATFTLTFGEAGEPVPAPALPDTRAGLLGAARAIERDAPAKFADRFNVALVPSFVEMASGAIVTAAVASATSAGALLAGGGPALRAFESGIRLLPQTATVLAREPLALGAAVAGFVSSISALGGSPRRRLDRFAALIDSALATAEVIGATPARMRQRSNQIALQALIVTVAAAGLARAIAATQPSSYEDAVALRDAAADRLDAAALFFADRRADDDAAAVDTLRRAIVRDLTERGGSLARIYRIHTAASLPSLVLANRFFAEPALFETRAAEIVSRNRIRHPGFVPPGRSLEVLSDG